MKKNIYVRLIALLLTFTAVSAFAVGYEHRGYLNWENCLTCRNDQWWYLGNNPGFDNKPRPSRWGQRGFSKTWSGEKYFADLPEQDYISGFERSVYVDGK